VKLHWHKSALAWLGGRPGSAPKHFPRAGDVPPLVRQLAARLLAVGGERVVVQFGDEIHLNLAAGRGTLQPVPGVVRVRGARNQGHTNCARLWRAHPGRYRLGVGWVLDEGDWNCHTWLVDDQGRVVETTSRREEYFGVVLGPEEATGFVEVVEILTGVPNGTLIAAVKHLLDEVVADDTPALTPARLFEARCNF
jgi:hypothetical protein